MGCMRTYGARTREKRYVEVLARTTADGLRTPLEIVWEDGTRYRVDRVLDRRQAAATRCGGAGVRYTIRVLGHETYLFDEGPRWFVEARPRGGPS